MNLSPTTLDELLATPLLTAPDNFAHEVMQGLAPLPNPIQRLSLYVQGLALLAALALGIEQVLTVIVGVWFVQSLG